MRLKSWLACLLAGKLAHALPQVVSSNLTVISSGSLSNSSTNSSGTAATIVTNGSTSVEVETDSTATYASNPGPLTTLQPAIHWDHDLDDLSNLNPAGSRSIYYTESGAANPDEEHTFASMDMSYAYPAVVLEQSSYITAIQCVSGGLQITFSSSTAVSTAQQTWASLSNLILVTYSASCNAPSGSAPSLAYFQVSSLSFNGLSAVVGATEGTIQTAVNDFDLTWGTYSPSNSGTASSGSGTNSANGATNSTGSCGAPPASVIDGFPAAPCGDGFDAALDAALGYVSFDDDSLSATLENIAPGITDDNPDDYEDDDVTDSSENPTSSRLRRRWSFSIKALAQKVASGVSSAASSVASAAKATVAKAAEGVKAIGAVVNTINNLLNPSVDKTFNLYLGPTKLVSSPWGQAFEIYKKSTQNQAKTASASVALYCVDCSVNGKVHVGGRLSISILQAAITSGSVGLDGNFYAGLNLGLVASAVYSQQFKTPIASAGVPGLTIPNVVTIGPVLALDAQLNIDIKAYGQILAGASMSIPNFNATVDLVGGDSYVGGFTPVFTPRFEVDGNVTAAAGLGLPITIGVGLDIIPLKTRKLVSIINTPSVVASATYAYSNTNPGSCNNGIAYSVNFQDDTSYDLFGLKSGSIYKYTSPPLVSGCKSLGSSSSSTLINSSTSSSLTSSLSSGTITSSIITGPTTSSTSSISSTSITSGTMAANNTSGGLQGRALGRRQASSTEESASAATSSIVDIDDPDFNDGDYADGTQSLNSTDADTLSDSEYESLLSQAFNDEDASQDEPNSDGSVYTLIEDSTGQYVLYNDYDDGNFYLQAASDADSGTYFLSFDNISVSDDSGRIMHYHPDTMSAFGVSRWRMSTEDDFPNTADIVTLVPVDYDDSSSTPPVYVAVDTDQNAYYTVVCNIEDQYSKLFLVADPVDGVQALLATDLQFILTGGVVQDCSYIALYGSGEGFS